MRKILAAALVVVSLLHQGLAMAADGHHHDGGAVHEDRSDESKRHLQSDDALDAELLIAAGTACPARPVAAPPAISPDHPKPSPFLDGPARPPRLTA